MSSEQTDLGLRSRIFSLKINKLPTFSEITDCVAMGKNCVYMVR